MAVTQVDASIQRHVLPLQLPEESSDENHSEDWGADESDGRTSSSSEPASRFSLIALPSKVRDTVFRKPYKKTKERSSTADSTRTSSASSTPRDSMLVSKTLPESKEVEKFRTFWDEKLRTAMNRLKHAAASDASRPEQDDVFHLLLKLYAHQDVVPELYRSYDFNATEFEFYIPQLCTFLLHGNYAKQHQLECFLMSRSGDSLPFAHRLTWFLRSFCDNAKEYESEYLSVTASVEQENADLLTAIGMRAGVPAILMNRGLCVQEVSALEPQNLRQRRSIIFPTDDEMNMASDEVFANYLLEKRNSVQHDARKEEGTNQQSVLFQQTPKFVEALTDLAEKMIPTPRAERNKQLREGLTAIEAQMLPSDVIYLPIGNSYHRVKGIQIDECFTFSTKERVPYFLCVEVLDYSSSSCAAVSKQQRKRRRSVASRNSSRVFSLRLPFKKSDSDLLQEDDSPVSSSTSLESELSLVPSPSVASPLPEMEKDRPVLNGVALQRTTSASVVRLGKEVVKEVGGWSGSKSFHGVEGIHSDGGDQQDRLGQWNLPRSRRRNNKDYYSSASSRSGEKFDTFYSSWCTQMAQKGTDDDYNDLIRRRKELLDIDSSVNENVDTAMTGVKPADMTMSAARTESPPSDSQTVVEDLSFLLQKPQNGGNLNQCTDKLKDFERDAFIDQDTQAFQVGVTPCASTISAQTARPPVFVKKPTNLPALKSERTSIQNGTSEKQTVISNAPAGMFAAIFAKKLQEKTEASALNDDVTDTLMSTLEIKAATRNKLTVHVPMKNMETDFEAYTAKCEPNGRISVVLEAEEGDAEDTDSNGGIFSDDDSVACEPEPSPAKIPTPSFVSWFSRKPASSLSDIRIEEGTSSAIDEPPLSSHQELEPSKTVEDNITSPSNEPFQHRQRDLNGSLDFADPSAWKEKFELEDGFTDDDPEPEAGDTDASEEEFGDESLKIGEDEEKPMIVFREHWSEKEERIRRESPFGDHPGWRLLSVIVKSNDDLRQEQFAAQLIAQCDRIFREYSLPLSLRPYNVIATSAKTGLIEAVPDTVSLDSLKRNDPSYTTLLDFYYRLHGDKDTASFARAQRNFVESLAAYSIVCYVFQIKDRHNGNILIDTDGHVIHIDFGFLLTNSPGSNWNFERAPFKLTDEFVELMGGPRSSTFRYFRSLCIRAYLALRRNMDQIVLLVEMMLVGNADLPCFAGGKKAVTEGLRARLKPGARTSACQVFVNQLIDQSINNWRTRWYDKYQRAYLGIL
ncbi:hypothetical protein CCR75_005417 [Bremia lactucae]|uniref:1-phosphatidylinositol 4-kinase n=1 Tax=Bremia lactucae TaxID=4779 RepID=A0A976ID56_BRELC|nr:hypothetical protein CCR75_005417 [Bremia lactucae]